jgi:hypothetical protein
VAMVRWSRWPFARDRRFRAGNFRRNVEDVVCIGTAQFQAVLRDGDDQLQSSTISYEPHLGAHLQIAERATEQ